MTDIVERLRRRTEQGVPENPDGPEAADEIARLRAALWEIVDLAAWEPTRATNIARRALEREDG